MRRSKYPDTLEIWGITWTKTKGRRGWIGPAITDPEDPLLALCVEYQRIVRRDGYYIMEDPSITLDRFGWDEGELELSQCIDCLLKHADGPTCEAFPQGIPWAIQTNQVSHREPYPGDGGIQWAQDPDMVDDVTEDAPC